MTLLEAIQLVQTRPAGEVTAEQLSLLRMVLAQHPALAAAVGGQERLSTYLAEAETAVAARPAESEAPPPEPALTHEQAPPPRAKSRRTLELSIYGALIALAGAFFYWQLVPLIHPADSQSESAAAAKQPTASPGQTPPPAAATQKPVAVTSAKSRPPIESAAPAESPPEEATANNEWRGWQITLEAGARTEFQSVWDLTDPGKPEPVKLLTTHGGPVRLTLEIDIPNDAKMLALDCRQMIGTPENPQAAAPVRAPGTIKLLVDGKQTATSPVPAPDYPGSLMLSLDGAQGRRAKLTLEYVPADPLERVIWRNFSFSKAPSDVLLASGEPEPRNKHLRLWLRSDSGVRDAAGRGPTEPGFDAAVQSWEDRSTGGRHLTSDTGDASRRPAFVPTQPLVGGRPVVAFDASNDFLRYSVGGVYAGGPSTTLAVFHLSHYHSTKDRRRFCVVFDTQPSAASLGANNRAGVKNGHTVMFGPLGVSSSGQLHGQFVIATALCNGASSFFDVNGGLRSAGAMENVRGEANFVMGLPAAVPQGFGGYPTQIAELLVYDRALTDVECRQLGQYLSRRYSIPGGY